MVKIFDAIVLFTRKAIERMKTDPSDIQGRHDSLRTAQRACGAAIDAIDFELGGELAASNAASAVRSTLPRSSSGKRAA